MTGPDGFYECCSGKYLPKVVQGRATGELATGLWSQITCWPSLTTGIIHTAWCVCTNLSDVVSMS